MGRIVTLEELIPVREQLRREGKTVVFTNGVFDLLHRGHVILLNRAKALGDVLVVGLNTDASVRKIKGDLRPIVPQEDRAFILANLAAVDYVVLFDEETPYNLISALLPDILVKGADYKVEEIVGHDVVLAHGGKVIPIELVNGCSTTRIIERIRALFCSEKEKG